MRGGQGEDLGRRPADASITDNPLNCPSSPPPWVLKMAGPGSRHFSSDFYWPMTLRLLSRYALALLFVLAGTWHFVQPATYLAIMPPQLQIGRAHV